jgi:hypothetical protein
MLRLLGARLRALVIALVFVSSLTVLFSPAKASAADRYGVTDSYIRGVDAPSRRAALTVLSAGGVRLMRSSLSWGAVEASAPGADGVHHYNWAENDAWVTELALAGIRLYPLIAYAAPWAAVTPGSWNSRPRDPAQYATFAAAVAARYGTGGSFWAEHPALPQLPAQSVEIWNEENAGQFWKEQTNAPRDYARLYLTTRAAVRRVTPGMEVVVGGLVDNGAESFLTKMAAAEPTIGKTLDAVAYHSYLLAPVDAVRRISSVRRTLDKIGAKGKPIQITEVGWSSLEMSDDKRGDNYATFSRLTADPALNVTKVMPFAAMSNEGDPNHWDQWFGLLNHNGTPKTAFTRWSAGMAAADRAGTTRGANAASSTRTSAASLATSKAQKLRRARIAARAASRAKSRTLKTRSA